jgi:hypothetical protein
MTEVPRAASILVLTKNAQIVVRVIHFGLFVPFSLRRLLALDRPY